MAQVLVCCTLLYNCMCMCVCLRCGVRVCARVREWNHNLIKVTPANKHPIWATTILLLSTWCARAVATPWRHKCRANCCQQQQRNSIVIIIKCLTFRKSIAMLNLVLILSAQKGADNECEPLSLLVSCSLTFSLSRSLSLSLSISLCTAPFQSLSPSLWALSLSVGCCLRILRWHLTKADRKKWQPIYKYVCVCVRVCGGPQSC